MQLVRPTAWKRLRGAALALTLSAAVVTPVAAKIDLVTLPEKGTSQLTIYNSQDLTLARETRTLSFSKGLNEIQFSWANTLIDPTSLQIDLGNAAGLSVLDAVYPANTSQLIVWNIEAEEESSAEVEISYFTSGLSWSADYIIKANREQTQLSMQQYTTVSNHSGEDFTNASTRVVVGEVNLIELIADLARKGIQVDERMLGDMVGREVFARKSKKSRSNQAGMMMAMESAMPEVKSIIKKAVSEYYLFAIEGKETLDDGWKKELPNPLVEEIPFNLSYEINPMKYGNQVVKFYKFKNDEDHELGTEPVPDGTYYVYSDDGRGGLRFEGTTQYKYIPIGQEAELNLGSDGMVLLERETLEKSRRNFEYDDDGDVIGWDDVLTNRLEIKNARDQKVPVKLTEYLEQDWEIKSTTDEDYKKMDDRSVRWEFDIEADSEKVIEYTVVYRRGSRQRSR